MMPGFISPGDAARLTGITRQTWTAWAKQGKFTAVRLGKRWLIPVVEFEKLLAENTRGSVTPEPLRSAASDAVPSAALPEGCPHE